MWRPPNHGTEPESGILPSFWLTPELSRVASILNSRNSMPQNWLTDDEIEPVLQSCSEENASLILELRDFVRGVVPEVAEAIKFHSICYFKPDMPYGSIGGNVCGIGEHKGKVYLSFIHGASLPDPDGLLQGDGKAMRKIPISSSADIQRSAFERLIIASVHYNPAR
jgi:hypothetical protein